MKASKITTSNKFRLNTTTEKTFQIKIKIKIINRLSGKFDKIFREQNDT